MISKNPCLPPGWAFIPLVYRLQFVSGNCMGGEEVVPLS